jgi:DNA replication protein DnaC
MGLEWTLDTFPGDRAALEKTRALLDSDKWIIYIGTYGTGKTSLASCVYKHAIDRAIEKYGETAMITGYRYEGLRRVDFDRPAEFWNVEQLLTQHAKTWHNEDLIDHLERLKTRCPLLILDGVGETAYADALRDDLSQLIGQRYTRWRTLRTVMTSNWKLPDFKAKLGGWSASRLEDVCEVIIPEERMR